MIYCKILSTRLLLKYCSEVLSLSIIALSAYDCDDVSYYQAIKWFDFHGTSTVWFNDLRCFRIQSRHIYIQEPLHKSFIFGTLCKLWDFLWMKWKWNKKIKWYCYSEMEWFKNASALLVLEHFYIMAYFNFQRGKLPCLVYHHLCSLSTSVILLSWWTFSMHVNRKGV